MNDQRLHQEKYSAANGNETNEWGTHRGFPRGRRGRRSCRHSWNWRGRGRAEPGPSRRAATPPDRLSSARSLRPWVPFRWIPDSPRKLRCLPPMALRSFALHRGTRISWNWRFGVDARKKNWFLKSCKQRTGTPYPRWWDTRASAATTPAGVVHRPTCDTKMNETRYKSTKSFSGTLDSVSHKFSWFESWVRKNGALSDVATRILAVYTTWDDLEN